MQKQIPFDIIIEFLFVIVAFGDNCYLFVDIMFFLRYNYNKILGVFLKETDRLNGKLAKYFGFVGG